MSATLQELVAAVDQAAQDVDAAQRAREALVAALDADADPAAVHAVADALWRMGVVALMHGRNTDEAMALFKRAVDKKDPITTPHARTSYALVLHNKGKVQQAVFELRKVIRADQATAEGAHALNLLCTLLREHKAKPSEIEKADKDRINALTAMVRQASADSEDLAHWTLQLALAHKEGGSRTECKKLLEQVAKLGKRAGPQTLETAQTLLKGM